MIDRDAEYYQMRAEQEIELAQRATKPEVVAAHYRLSELYLARLAPAPKLFEVCDEPTVSAVSTTPDPASSETFACPAGLLDHH